MILEQVTVYLMTLPYYQNAETKKTASKIAIIDLDVHHGDGNANLLADDSDCLILNMFGEKNYPSKKPDSNRYSFTRQLTDEKYLLLLEQALTSIVSFDPDLILYQAGVDALSRTS